jgi:antitoxin MazE
MVTAHLVKIGNSKGLILPTSVRKKCHIENDVIYEVKNNKIIISSTPKEVRKGWKEKLLKLKADQDKTPAFMGNTENKADRNWTW